MLQFQCQHCGQKLTVAERFAGRRSRCPRCRNDVTIPQVAAPEPSESVDDELTLLEPPARQHDHDKALLDLKERHQSIAEERAEELRQEKEMLESLGFWAPVEHTGERQYAWPLDVLLYPTSGSGLTILALMVGVPFLLRLLQRFLPLVGHGGLLFMIANVAFGLYLGYYFADCVYDSAKGGTRAPQALRGSLDWGEIWSRVSYLLAVYIVYVLPAVLFGMFAGRHGPIFWGLIAYGLVFFPMGLLAMVMLDSVSALNPLFLLGSILRTPGPYFGLMLLLAVVILPIWLASGRTPEGLRPLHWDFIGLAISGYGTFVLAHVLGRFYWRYSEKLDWGM